MRTRLCVLILSVAIASCSKNDVIDAQESQAISFSKPFINNSTKVVDPSWVPEVGQSFNVWGTLTNGSSSALVFDGTTLTNNGNTTTVGSNTVTVWDYTGNPQYWVPGCVYKFSAVVGLEEGLNSFLYKNKNTTQSALQYVASTQKDLLYSETQNYTGQLAGNPVVGFTLDHLLSKVKISFINDYTPAANLYIEVKNVKLNNILNEGMTLVTHRATATSGGKYYEMGTWGQSDISSQETTYTQSFGNVMSDANAAVKTEADNYADIISPEDSDGLTAQFERLLIPQTYTATLTLSFDMVVKIKLSDGSYVEVPSLSRQNYEITPDNISFNAGCSYNLIVTVGGELEPISFTVVEFDGNGNWGDNTDKIIQ